MIDGNGYRSNVGIVLANAEGKVLWAKRVGQDAWQFPQGGMRASESPEEALYRELYEEVGLIPQQVQIIGRTKGWLRYKVPKRFLRDNKSSFIGQKQKWFLLKMLAHDEHVSLLQSELPEFERWQWVSYWYPLGKIVSFKQDVYRHALKELAPYLPRCFLD